MKLGTRIAAVTGIASASMLVLSQVAIASTYRPNKLGDHAPGACTKADCTLREAVIAANAHSGADVIALKRGKTYALSVPGLGEQAAATGDLDITDSLTIKRAPAQTRRQRRQRAIVDANGIDRVFETVGTLDVVFDGLVVREGNASGGGGDGGVDVDRGTATFVNSVIRDNHGDDDGGVGTNYAALVFRGSRVVGNRAVSDVGGIDANGTSLTLNRSVVSGNSGHGSGGGAFVQNAGLIVKSAIDHNHSDGDGGGILSAGAPLTVLSSTIFENSGTNGGGIRTDASLEIRDSTIANNRTTEEGGAIFMLSPAHLILNSSTVVRNLGHSGSGETGGIFGGGGTTSSIGNSIIALNALSGAPGQQNCSGFNTSAGHNLLGGPCGGLGGGSGDFIDPDPKLGLVANNGGPTPTIALLKGSPAINKGGSDAEPRDQRGSKRTGLPDIGAFEFVPKKKHRH